MDQKLAEHSLTNALDRKGIIIHIVDTSTERHPQLNLDTGQTTNRERDQQQSGEQQQQKQQQEQKKRPNFPFENPNERK